MFVTRVPEDPRNPDDPMRTAVRQMQGVLAQLDRAMIVKKLRDARRNKIRRGMHANGPAPYGWRTVDGELVPVHAELAVIDSIRSHRSAGLNRRRSRLLSTPLGTAPARVPP